MRIVCCHSIEELQPYQQDWDRLAGDCIFRTWTWLSSWWRHYGDQDGRSELYVLLALREGDPAPLAGVMPCYVHASRIAGRTIRLMGDGEVCSDHTGLLVDAADQEDVAATIADFLSCDATWDAIELAAVDASDGATRALARCLQQARCQIDLRQEQSCWRIALPASWDEFLALQSKSHRKQLRRLETRVLQTDAAEWRLIESQDDFERGWAILEDLHQRRRQSLGEPGCFSWPRWAAFHREVAERLLATGELRLSWLELGGAPVAAEYHFARGSTVFAYQGGLAPEAADAEPGRLSLVATIQHAIAEGRNHFDLLRGDEPYKPHWRAQPEPVHRVLAIPPRVAPRLRYRARTTLHAAGRWARHAVRLLS